jgi:hypothetical protein
MELLEISDFTAGINRFVEPSFLTPSESRVLKNGTISTGALVNEAGHDESSAEGGFFLFNTLDFTGKYRWFYHEKPIVWYELTKRIYKSALGRNLPITAEDVNGNDLGTLGILKPTVEPSISETTGGVFYKDEVYNYVFTYVKGKSAESQPSKPAQMTITADGNAVKLTIPTTPAIPAGVTEINIYRQGGGTHSFMFVETIPISKLDFIDTFTASELGHNLDSWNNEPPPKGIILDTEYKSMLIGHIEGDNVLRFSQEVYVDAWSSLETISLDSTIIRVVEFNGQLIVLCTTAIYRISGTNIDNFTVARVPSEQGCLFYESVVESRGLLFWQSEDGISAFDGAQVTVISTNKLPKAELRGRDFCAVARDEEVFFADTDGILAVDVARGLSWRDYDGINANLRGFFYIHKEDRVYGSDGNKTYSLFTNPNKRLALQYKTGEITMGSLITLKQVVKVMIFGTGRFDFQLKVDGTVVVTDYEVDLDGVRPNEVLLPMGTQGRRLEILMNGKSVEPQDVQKINNILVGYDVLGVGK